MAWEQLEIPGVTQTWHAGTIPAEYGQATERGAKVLTCKITVNEDELYEIEMHYQEGPLDGICTYLVRINDEEVGRLTHFRPDGAFALARKVLNAFPAPEKTLMEEGGAHTRVPFAERVRSAVAGEPELPSTQLNQEAVGRVRERMRAEGWPHDDDAVGRLLDRLRDDLVYREAEASAGLAGDEP